MKEIVEMSTDELLTKRRDLRQESLHLRLQQQSGQLEQPSRLRLLRRDVARIETLLSQRATDREKVNLWPRNNNRLLKRRRNPCPSPAVRARRALAKWFLAA